MEEKPGDPHRTRARRRCGWVSGGRPFSRGQLYKLLANPIYAGRLGRKGRVHAGQHPAIIDPAPFDAVQAQLAAHGHAQRRQNTAASAHLLAGRIRMVDGKPTTPSHAQKGQTRYRYDLARAVLDGGETSSSVRRIAAAAIEAAVLAGLPASWLAQEGALGLI